MLCFRRNYSLIHGLILPPGAAGASTAMQAEGDYLVFI